MFTMRNEPIKGESEQQLAFEIVVNDYMTVPALQYFDSERVVRIETDVWDDVSAGVLCQYDDDGVLNPVACFSKKHTPVRRNSNIYDKNVIAMIKALEEWRLECDGATNPIQFLTDHQNINYFLTKKHLY